MAHTTRKRPDREVRKCYALSPESVEFLETLRKKRHALSVSSVLEEILQAVRRERRKATMEKAVANYYVSLSYEEVEEQTRWGEFALLEYSSEGA